MKTIGVYTLGCKVNKYETDAVLEMFLENGFKEVDFREKADVYLINTCMVTKMAEKKSKNIIRRGINKNKNAVVVVMGCYSQLKNLEVEKIKGVSLIFGTSKRHEIYSETIKILNNLENKKDLNFPYTFVQESRKKDYDGLIMHEKQNTTRAFIKIQDGCDRFCSYCIIPYTRGNIRSRSLVSIKQEVENLSNYHKEVVLTGIHLESYGKDYKVRNLNGDFEKISLIDVVEEVSKLENIKRIRLGSLEPKIITDDFLKRLSKIEKFCPQFHLSLQSGCDLTLKRMNRRYTTKEYYESVKKIRSFFDEPSITTDVITGFKGETSEEFRETYEYLKKINLYEMHIFPYSKREGTVAYNMEEFDVDDEIKKQRTDKLIELSNLNKRKFEENMVGKVYSVLFEQKHNNYYCGYTKNYVEVFVKSSKNLENEIVNVRILKRDKISNKNEYGLFGELI